MRGTAAQVVVHAALHNAKQRRVVAFVRALAALGPAQAELHGTRDYADIDRFAVHVHRRTLVENHDDVAAQHFLDVHGFFRPKEDFAAIGRCSEGDALFGDLASMGQREDLEAAGIGEDGAAPFAEPVQAAVRLDHLQARTQVEVEGVAEDDLGAKVSNLLGEHAFDRAVRADRHEGWRFHGAARKRKAATTGGAIGAQQFEGHSAHGRRLKE